jgi:hypothetical protein
MERLDNSEPRIQVRPRLSSSAACAALVVAFFLARPSFAVAQSASQNPPQSVAAPSGEDASARLSTFGVATIKTSNPNADGARLMYKADGIAVSDFPLALLIRFAFNTPVAMFVIDHVNKVPTGN